MTDPLFTIRIDSREQDPLDFSPYPVETVGPVKGKRCAEFDYCIEGDDGFAVERKSLTDFIGSLGNSTRWQRELNKMRRARELGFPSLQYVVEAPFIELTDPGSYRHCQKLKPNFILKRWRELVYRERTCVTFADGPVLAAEAVFLLLKSRNEELKYAN